MAASHNPATRALIRELAEIEDEMYLVRAARTRSRATPPLDAELLRLARREQQVLARLRRQRIAH
ncbi:hypothetical protein ACK8HX_08910 [Oryzobacter sp. R7]|uniref:hypothetical protein n=1 Tax=Oryzobacter faecalis TaxID=3388656 RepID=UPI00398D3BAA